MSDGEAAPPAAPPPPPPAAAPPATDMKARLAQLAARKRAEAEAAAAEAADAGEGAGDDDRAGPSSRPAGRGRDGGDGGGDSGADSGDLSEEGRDRRRKEKQKRKRERKAAAAALAAGLPVPAPGGAGQEPAKKKKKKKEAAAAAAARPRRPQRVPKPAGEAARAREGGGGGGGGEGGGGEGGSGSDEEPEVAPRTAEDDAFIDDEGAEPAAGYYSDGAGDDRAGSPTPSSGMEEDAEFENLFKGGKKKGGRAGGRGGGRSGMTSAELTAASDFLARIEAAADDDAAAVAEGRPAVHRLRLAPALEAALASARTQEWFLNNGVLGVLRVWLEPHKVRPAATAAAAASASPPGDGQGWAAGGGGGGMILPPARVREAVLRGLTSLNVDAADPDRRAQLAASGVAKAVMVLSRVPGASPTETRLARALVAAWARPVWEAHRDVEGEAAARAARAADALAARAARAAADESAKAAAKAAEDARGGPLAPGDRGFRRRALPPAQARLDFVARPEADERAALALAGGGGGGRPGGGPSSKAARTRVEKALDALSKRGRAGPARGSRQIAALKTCHRDHPVAKFWGVCNQAKHDLDACFREEKRLRIAANKERAAREKARLAARRAAAAGE